MSPLFQVTPFRRTGNSVNIIKEYFMDLNLKPGFSKGEN
jgi:hypothetical protein